MSGLEDATEQEDVSRQVPASSLEVTPALGTSGALVKPGWSLSPQTLPPPLPPCAFPLSRHVCLKGLPFPFHLPKAAPVLRGWLMRSRGSRRWSRPRWAAAPPSPLPSRRPGSGADPLPSRSAPAALFTASLNSRFYSDDCPFGSAREEKTAVLVTRLFIAHVLSLQLLLFHLALYITFRYCLEDKFYY